MADPWKLRVEELLARGEQAALAAETRPAPARMVRYLASRPASASEEEKFRAVHALGKLFADSALISAERATETLRRFFWALNNESGAVPHGIPEAIGEILAARPEFQGEFLPLLCSMATDEEVLQTGPIERGVFWALGRLGRNAALPQVVRAVERAASEHPDQETRRVAREALRQLR